jgi:hypothetical protein
MVPLLIQIATEEMAPKPHRGHNAASSPEDALRWIRWIQKEVCRGLALSRIQRVFQDVLALFEGRFPGHQACDTRYHDLEHSLRLLPPFCQIAAALARERADAISSRDLELGVIAVLLHDSGYIRKKDDAAGTGAKYTFRHIDRSVAFARSYLPSLGYGEDDLIAVEEMICCTGVKAEMEQVHFISEANQWMGYALGTSDLLAQMADSRYVEKLPLLFHEFHEAYQFEGSERLRAMGVQTFTEPMDLIRKTPLFFQHVVVKRLAGMGSVYRLLEDPRTGRNLYLEKIQEQLERIARIS